MVQRGRTAAEGEEWTLPRSKLGSAGREASAGTGRRAQLGHYACGALPAWPSRRRWRNAVWGSEEVRGGGRNGAVTSSLGIYEVKEWVSGEE